MAFHALRSRVQLSPLSGRGFASSTTPKMAASISASHGGQPSKGIVAALGPAAGAIMILAGMTSLVGVFATHTAVQHVFRDPAVQVTKKKRECVPEVDYPDAVIHSADKYDTKSFFRKFAHISDKRKVPDAGTQIFTRSRECETLKSVGVRTQEK